MYVRWNSKSVDKWQLENMRSRQFFFRGGGANHRFVYFTSTTHQWQSQTFYSAIIVKPTDLSLICHCHVNTTMEVGTKLDWHKNHRLTLHTVFLWEYSFTTTTPNSLYIAEERITPCNNTPQLLNALRRRAYYMDRNDCISGGHLVLLCPVLWLLLCVYPLPLRRCCP